jgi:hypothetical protein
MNNVRSGDRRGAIPTSFAGQQYDSSQTVLCTVPQLSACGKFNNVFDASDSKRVAQNTQIEQRGLMRFRIADFSFQDTSLMLKSANENFFSVAQRCQFSSVRLRSLLHAKARCDRGRFWPSRPLRCRHRARVRCAPNSSSTRCSKAYRILWQQLTAASHIP